jgi:hypothetical protein
LSSTEDNVVLDRRDGGTVEGCVGNVGFQDVQLFNIDELEDLVSEGI